MTRAAHRRCCLMLAVAVCAMLSLAAQADASCGDWLAGHGSYDAYAAEVSSLPPSEAANSHRLPAKPCSGPECRQSQPRPAAPPRHVPEPANFFSSAPHERLGRPVLYLASGRQPDRAMPDRELRYKGYKIKLTPNGRGWRVRARPLSPDKPILSDHSFVVAGASEDDAIEQAKRRIDRLLTV